MGLLISKPAEEHLTRAHGALEDNIRKTYAGQAHFAGTGPEDKTCRLCKYWLDEGRAASGILKPAKCGRFKEMTGKHGNAVPHQAPACKYFVENEKPPQACYTA